MIFRAPFDLWAATLDLYLVGYTGRHLADLPWLPLHTWYAVQWPAWEVAHLLAWHLGVRDAAA